MPKRLQMARDLCPPTPRWSLNVTDLWITKAQPSGAMEIIAWKMWCAFIHRVHNSFPILTSTLKYFRGDSFILLLNMSFVSHSSYQWATKVIEKHTKKNCSTETIDMTLIMWLNLSRTNRLSLGQTLAPNRGDRTKSHVAALDVD